MGYSGGYKAEFPIVSNGRVVGFEAYLPDLRQFPIDMAGFAINVQFLLRDEPVLFVVNAKKTTGETGFLQAAGFTLPMLEPLAQNCTRVLVW